MSINYVKHKIHFGKKKRFTSNVAAHSSRNFTDSESTNPRLSVGSCLKQQVLVNRWHVVAART